MQLPTMLMSRFSTTEATLRPPELGGDVAIQQHVVPMRVHRIPDGPMVIFDVVVQVLEQTAGVERHSTLRLQAIEKPDRPCRGGLENSIVETIG